VELGLLLTTAVLVRGEAELVLSVLLHRQNRPDDEVALVVPDRETYTTLLARLRPALELLGIGAYVVHEESRVEEVLAPARRSR